jgi:hypothetical protein
MLGGLLEEVCAAPEGDRHERGATLAAALGSVSGANGRASIAPNHQDAGTDPRKS